MTSQLGGAPASRFRWRLRPLMAMAAALMLGLGAPLAASDARRAAPSPWLQHFPWHSDLETASAADVVVWQSRREGVRTLSVARGPDFRPKTLWTAPGDDGIALSGLQLSADGEMLVFVRGEGPTADGQTINPRNLARPVERQILALRTAGGAVQVVAGGPRFRGSAVVLSPDGSKVAWADGPDIWVRPLDGRSPAAVVATTRGSAADLAWSPDGTRLAFASLRGTHSFIAVLDQAAGRILYMRPSIDQDRFPTWSPDGRKLAFLRTGEPVRTYRFDRRLEGSPWSVEVCDPATGAPLWRWEAARGQGSQYWPVEENPPFQWLDGERLVLPWEKSGWLALYAVGRTGLPERLTPEKAEVFSYAVGSRGDLVFAAADGHLDRIVPWRGGLGRKPERIGAPGLYTREVKLLSTGSPLVMGFGLATPPQPVLPGGKTDRPLDPGAVPPAYPRDPNVDIEWLTVTAADGFITRGQLLLPRSRKPGSRLPLIVRAHGGSRSHEGEGLGDNNMSAARFLAERGYAVFILNYRSGTGYGLGFREAAGYGGGGGTDVQDFVAAMQLLRARPDIDADRAGVFGISYGGYLVTALLAKHPDLFRAGISVVGVADWQMELELDRGGKPLPFRTSERMRLEDLAFRSSANADLSGWKAPLLLISSDDDPMGWMAQAVDLGQSLRRLGVRVDTQIWPGGTHQVRTHEEYLGRWEAMADYFDCHLARRPQSTSRKDPDTCA